MPVDAILTPLRVRLPVAVAVCIFFSIGGINVGTGDKSFIAFPDDSVPVNCFAIASNVAGVRTTSMLVGVHVNVPIAFVPAVVTVPLPPPLLLRRVDFVCAVCVRVAASLPFPQLFQFTFASAQRFTKEEESVHGSSCFLVGYCNVVHRIASHLHSKK